MVNQTQKAPTMDEFRTLLKRHGLKATPQRIAVHEAMMELGHASADMVTEHISSSGRTSVTVASVYNILSQLALLGIYHHRMSSNSKMYFDVTTSNHLHLYDTVNNVYRDIFDDDLLDLIQSRLGKRRFRGFKVDGIDIQILCHPSKTKIPKKS
ncbi:MAG: transcriptional repressor [Bacteroidales bacterium]|jgi:Fe2+ or Zn2+ uptake regulation protein|nr:transcriptional repressor [Bacteroidales bacterium]MBQ9175175.1 transcriptional repressor [Bacteroidales bacterium]MBR6416624.1 transcriptional repressor [Bacteroidales bacterium]